MCIVFSYIAKRCNPNEYKLIILNNRDEFHFRPSKPAHYVTENSIYGMDMTPGKEGGTWLGTSRIGKISVLLNLNSVDYGSESAGKEGRGFLVPNFLNSQLNSINYVESIKEIANSYNPFNLLFFERNKKDLWDVNIFDNVACQVFPIHDEFVSISNHQYKKNLYPKTLMGEKLFSEIVNKFNNTSKETELKQSLINLAKYSTDKFKDTDDVHGYTREQICIDIPKYGTRTHTIILVDDNNRVTINEKTMKSPIVADNPEWIETNIEFNLDPINS
ncbi:unnamed protein product [Brachionus calyciflorus]|uniref:Uncharacterized protein n=1 Tax=Brachionus calyciflorus TaxID=104777 RepID=A0A813ZFQ2_9BILA|nr:unnamed protein product [Brachionus calyciflorus]